MTGAEMLLELKAKGKSDKYSENLGKWLRKFKNWPIYVVFSRHSHIDGSEVEYDPQQTQAHHIILCLGDDDGWASGARLSQIISNGTRAERYAYNNRQWKIVNLPDWWQGYRDGGKCFIDPEHRLYQDRERWETGRKTRQCRWCGHLQEKITKRKTYYVWR